MTMHSIAEPRYATIKKFVTDAVSSGQLKPGDRVLSESALVERFDVSRMTVIRALRDHLIEIRNIAEEIRARGHEYSAVVVRNAAERASRDVAALMGISVGTAMFHSIIVHHESGVPIQLEDRFVLASAAPDYGSVDFSKMTPNEYLMKAAPLERFAHKVRAIMPDAPTRKLLLMDEGEPCLLVERQTWSRSRIVSHARLIHPGSRFEFSDTFVP
jgi:GntR family histidine utilization transcriptional repressor